MINSILALLTSIWSLIIITFNTFLTIKYCNYDTEELYSCFKYSLMMALPIDLLIITKFIHIFSSFNFKFNLFYSANRNEIKHRFILLGICCESLAIVSMLIGVFLDPFHILWYLYHLFSITTL